jgi:hypothetical protein
MDTQKSPAGPFLRWAALLTVLLPQACLWVMALLVHHRRAAVLDAMGDALAGEQAVLLTRGVAEFRNILVAGGAATAGLALLGFLVAWFAWSRARRTGERSWLPLLAAGGLSLAHALVGVGLLWRNLGLMHGFRALPFADAAERAVLLGKVFELLPGLGPFVLAALLVLALAALVAAFQGARARLRLGGAGLAAGLGVFLLGLAGFVATRGHAEDADRVASLLQESPGTVDVLFAQPDLDLPLLARGRALEQAPVLVAGRGMATFEGRLLGRLDELAAGEERLVPELLEVLSTHRRNFESLHPGQEFPGRIILQFDRSVPGAAAARLLETSAAAGYRKVQIATGGLLRRESQVLGAFVRYQPRGLPFALVEAPAEGALDLPGDEPFGAWAGRLDAAAARGELRVRMPPRPPAP